MDTDALVELIRRTIVSGTHSDLSTECDQLASFWDGQTYSSGLKWIFRNVPDVPFAVQYAKWDEQSLKAATLQPYDLTKLPADMLDKVLHRVKSETNIYHFVKFPKALFILYCVYGASWNSNPYIQKLKYYLKFITGGEMDAFHEDKRGDIMLREFGSKKLLSNDAMAPVRCLLLAHASLMHFGKHFVYDEEAFFDIISFFFDNPWVNVPKHKKLAASARLFAFSTTTSGNAYQTNPIGKPTDSILQFFRTEIRTLGNDSVAYSAYRKEIEEDLNELNQLVPRSARLHKALLSAPFTTDTQRCFCMLNTVEGLAGYLRADKAKTVEKYLTGPSNPMPTNPKFSEELRKTWTEIVADMDRTFGSKWESYRAYVAGITSFLTSRHAGVAPTITKLLLDGEVKEVSLKSKILQFWIDPKRHLDPAEVRAALSEANPGMISFRTVPGGKDQRVIFMIPLSVHLAAGYFASKLLRWMAKQPEFSVTKESSNLLGNHAMSMYATGTGKFLIDCSDFSSYDVTETEINTLNDMIDGVIEGLEKHVGYGEWGAGWGSLIDMVTAPWKRMPQAKFSLRVGNQEKIFTTNQLNSGEHDTISRGNVNNKVNGKVTVDALMRIPILRTAFRNLFALYQGDDMIRFWTIQDPSLYTAETHKLLASTSTEVARQNGFGRSDLKSMLRRFACEYLRKMFIFGVYMPRPGTIGYMTAERNNFDKDAVSSAQIYCAQIFEAIPRGMLPHVAQLLCFFFWNSKRSLSYRGEFFPGAQPNSKLGKKRDQEPSWRFNLPLNLYYTPRTYGGVGVMPGTLPGGSVDPVIALTLSNPLREKVNSLVSRLSQVGVARLFKGRELSLENMPALEAGVRYGKSFLAQDRIEASDRALDWLVSRKVAKKTERLRYANSIQVSVEKGLSDYGKTGAMIIDNKRGFIELLCTPAPQADMLQLKEFVWLSGLKIEYGNDVPYSLTCSDGKVPFAVIGGLSPDLTDFGARFGFGSREGMFRESLAEVFAPLQRDPFFPRFDVSTLGRILANLPDPEFRANWLIMMGAQARDAYTVASAVDTLADTLRFYETSTTPSEADQFASLLDTSQENVKRFVKINHNVIPQLDSTLLGIGTLLARYWPVGRILKEIIISPSVEYSVSLYLRHHKSFAKKLEYSLELLANARFGVSKELI